MNKIKNVFLMLSILFLQPVQGMEQSKAVLGNLALKSALLFTDCMKQSKSSLNLIATNKWVQAGILGYVGYTANHYISKYLENNAFFKNYESQTINKDLDDQDTINKKLKYTETITKFNSDLDDNFRDKIGQNCIIGALSNYLSINKIVDPFATFMFCNIWNNGRAVKDVAQVIPKLKGFSKKQLFSILGLGVATGIARSTIPSFVEKYTGEKHPVLSLIMQLVGRAFINTFATKIMTEVKYLESEYRRDEENFDWSKFKNDVKLRKSISDSITFGFDIYNRFQ